MLPRGLACMGYCKPGPCCTASDKVVALMAHSANATSLPYTLQLSHCGQLASLLTALLSVAGTLRQLYRHAMQMEVDFFSTQPGISSAPAVGMLVIDFDDTCTITDTTSLVFNTAIAATVEAAPGAPSYAHLLAMHMCALQYWQLKLHAACNNTSAVHIKP